MTKRIKIAAAALTLALCLCTAACGSSENYDDITDAPDVEVTDETQENDTTAEELNDNAAADISAFEGIWLADANNEYDSIKIDSEGKWTLYLSGEVADEGYLKYEPEWDGVYAYADSDGSGGRAVIQDDGRLYITTLGYFNSGEGMETIWYEAGETK